MAWSCSGVSSVRSLSSTLCRRARLGAEKIDAVIMGASSRADVRRAVTRRPSSAAVHAPARRAGFPRRARLRYTRRDARMPETRPPAPSPSTLVLLVRHGQTATTGIMLPGRAPGLHLSDEGREQAEGVATRLAPLPRVAAVYSSPLERARETAAPIARARDARGAHRARACSSATSASGRAAARRTWPSNRSGRPCSGTRAGSGFPGANRSRRCRRGSPARSRGSSRAIPGETIVAVSHADPIKAAVAHALGIASRSLPAHRDRHRVDHRHRVSPRGADRPDRELRGWRSRGAPRPRARREMSESFDFEAPDLFTAGAVGAARAARVLSPGPRGRRVVTLKAEKEQVAALGRLPGGHCSRSCRRAGPPTPGTWRCSSRSSPLWTVGSLGVGYDEDSGPHGGRGARAVGAGGGRRGGERRRRRRSGGGRRGRGRRRRASASPAPRPPPSSSAPARSSSAGRPICPMCSQPKDPGGHVCPRSNGHVVAS